MLHIGRLSCRTASERGVCRACLALEQPLGMDITLHRHHFSVVRCVGRLKPSSLWSGWVLSLIEGKCDDVTQCATTASHLVLRTDL